MKKRNTETKEAIFNILQEERAALSHEMIQEKLLVKMDRATVYRILNGFHEEKILHKIVADDGKQYFKFCAVCYKKKIEHFDSQEHHQHHHFYFRCVKCQKVECIEVEVKVPLPKGYVAHNFNAVVSGLCVSCT